MLSILMERVRQSYRTVAFPREAPALPERYRGWPRRDASCGDAGCDRCAAVCPTGAIARGPGSAWQLDAGRCLFCGDCAEACPVRALAFTREYRQAACAREALVVDGREAALPAAVNAAAKRLFGRSLKLRQVSAGGCNACEADVNVLATVVYDLGRFGIQFVASPRHADGLLVTGPVTRAMEGPLRKTWEAVPAPKLVVAVGACAISGGLFREHPETCGGVPAVIPVDLFVPGCPPHPATILDGLLRLLGRCEDGPDVSGAAGVPRA